MCNYYRKYIYNFAKIAKSMYDVTAGEEFTWNDDCDEAFQHLKDLLCSAPVLDYPAHDALVEIHTDASGYGIGGVCLQSRDEGKTWKPIAYCSRALKKHEQRYSVTQRECLAVLYSLRKIRPYVYGRNATVKTDHFSLSHLMDMKDPYHQLARWALEIASYNVNIIYTKGSSIPHADCLSRYPIWKDSQHEGYLILWCK